MKHFTAHRSVGSRIILLLLLAWLSGCKKDDPPQTILHGRVTEYGTHTPIADARIYVGCEESVPFGPSTFTLVDSLITDADGKFYKKYADDEICGSVSMLPYNTGYFKGTPLYPTTDNKAFEVVLDPVSWFKVVTIPDGGGGGISFSGTFTGASGWTTYPSDGIKNYIFSTPGNRIKFISWAYWANPNATFRQDSIYLPAHDTTTYTIHY